MDATIATGTQRTLAELEREIADNEVGFVKAGLALAEIRERKLYSPKFETFEDYCKATWNFQKRYANRLIESAKVVTMLGPIGPDSENGVHLPETETQARALSEFPFEDHQAIMAEAAAQAPKDESGKPKVTAKVIRNAGNTKSKPKKPKKPQKENTPKNGRESPKSAKPRRAAEFEKAFGALLRALDNYNIATDKSHMNQFRMTEKAFKDAHKVWLQFQKVTA